MRVWGNQIKEKENQENFHQKHKAGLPMDRMKTVKPGSKAWRNPQKNDPRLMRRRREKKKKPLGSVMEMDINDE